MENQNAQNLAEKIALLLQAEMTNPDLNSLQSSLEKINDRLDKIESQLTFQNPKSQIPNFQSNHPSREKFQISEAVAQEIPESLYAEKICTFEPNGKVCDHCSMCSSRGF